MQLTSQSFKDGGAIPGALDVPQLAVTGELTGANVRAALAGHVLGAANLTGTYALNPKVR